MPIWCDKPSQRFTSFLTYMVEGCCCRYKSRSCLLISQISSLLHSPSAVLSQCRSAGSGCLWWLAGRRKGTFTYNISSGLITREELLSLVSSQSQTRSGSLWASTVFKRACRPFSKQVENCVPKLDWDNHFFISDGHLISDLFWLTVWFSWFLFLQVTHVRCHVNDHFECKSHWVRNSLNLHRISC